LQDKLETIKFMAAHVVSKDKMLAAEITRPVAGGDVTFHLGIARRMENGALLKTKVRLRLDQRAQCDIGFSALKLYIAYLDRAWRMENGALLKTKVQLRFCFEC
jgi:hypothetical protein